MRADIKEIYGLIVMASLLATAGCDRVKPVIGGTVGSLKVAGQLLSEIQVTVFRVEGNTMQPIGFGTTDREGLFELVTNGAKGPLVLDDGEYRFTLESVGAPVQFPSEYATPQTTPLKKVWKGDDEDLELDVPAAVVQ